MDERARAAERAWLADPEDLEALGAYDRACARGGGVCPARAQMLVDVAFAYLVERLAVYPPLYRFGVLPGTTGAYERATMLARRLVDGETTLHELEQAALMANMLWNTRRYRSSPHSIGVRGHPGRPTSAQAGRILRRWGDQYAGLRRLARQVRGRAP